MPYNATGYHTCLDQGGPAFLLQNAPFLATQDPFLSPGYYFWEFRETDAHAWGRTNSRYRNGHYAICKCELTLHCLLDLTEPPGLDELRALEREMLDSDRIPVNLEIGPLIQYLRDLDNDEIFPYDSVRIRQDPPYKQLDQRPYVASRPQMLIWNPQFIICSFSNKAAVIRSRQLIYPERYRSFSR